MAALARGKGPEGRGKGVSRSSRWTCMNQGESAELDWLIRTRLGRLQHSQTEESGAMDWEGNVGCHGPPLQRLWALEIEPSDLF